MVYWVYGLLGNGLLGNGLLGYGLWLRGDGLWVVGEVVSDGVWVGVGASYRKRILQFLQLSVCQT